MCLSGQKDGESQISSGNLLVLVIVVSSFELEWRNVPHCCCYYIAYKLALQRRSARKGSKARSTSANTSGIKLGALRRHLKLKVSVGRIRKRVSTSPPPAHYNFDSVYFVSPSMPIYVNKPHRQWITFNDVSIFAPSYLYKPKANYLIKDENPKWVQQGIKFFGAKLLAEIKSL